MNTTNNQKSNVIETLIKRYKEIIKVNVLENELYKWRLIKKMKGSPDVHAQDFAMEIKALNCKENNLVYELAKATSKLIVSYNPEEYRKCFQTLYDEQLSLDKRINDFQSETLALYKLADGKHSSHHDERTISVYLTFHNPEKYTFYKSSYYRDYCKLLGIKPKDAGSKYVHYLELIHDLIDNYILEDNELLSLVDKELQKDDCYSDENRLILAQDILYQTLIMDSAQCNYWIFQGNPKVFDFETALKEEILTDWTVRSHKDKIKSGDKTILWVTGDQSGCYALGVVTSEPHENTFSPDDHLWKEADKSDLKVDIQITHNLINSPILKENIIGIDMLKNMKVGNQGTNFKATKEEYEALLELINYKESNKPSTKMNSPLNQILFGPPGTGKTYNTINKAIAIVNSDFDLTQPRDIVKKEYERLVEAGQIVFTTFHQSMSYEDFIEGIKPETVDNEVIYDIKPGIFKLICGQAKTKEISSDNFEQVYSKLHDEIKKNGEKLVLESIVHAKEFTIYTNSKNNLRFHANTEKRYEGVIKKDVIEHYLKTGETLDWPSYVKAVGLYLVSKFHYSKKEQEENKKFVLIIDEINRGNVSQIFGELITLIEDDKRLGNDEALEVTLPYSKEKFGVPPNLYIIGTMNTADRSVEALDAALRRRFSFEEMLPKPELLLTNEKTPKGFIDEINLVELLQKINKRLEVLLDKDHQIGHSYFLQVSTLTDLKTAFQHKIIPLLQEYFFGDYGKIGLVLGGGFVTVSDYKQDNLFADFSKEYDASELAERVIYKIENIALMDDTTFTASINSLINK